MCVLCLYWSVHVSLDYLPAEQTYLQVQINEPEPECINRYSIEPY